MIAITALTIVVTTTTHKTLRGPRGAMILVTENGIKKDPELSLKIDKAPVSQAIRFNTIPLCLFAIFHLLSFN